MSFHTNQNKDVTLRHSKGERRALALMLRVRWLSDDTPLLLLILSFFLLITSACGNNNTSSTDTQSASSTATAAATSTTSNKKTILFFGDSLTAGFGLDDPQQAFPGVIQHKIDSLKLPYNVVNAGNSGETTAGGLSRIDWVLKQKVDIFVLELGANDGLRGVPVAETRQNLQAIIDKVKDKYPNAKIILTGMQMPPSMGSAYTDAFKAVYPAMAKKNKIAFVPFLLAGVAGDPKLNQRDGIHPTAAGAKIVAENVWSVLKGDL